MAVAAIVDHAKVWFHVVGGFWRQGGSEVVAFR